MKLNAFNLFFSGSRSYELSGTVYDEATHSEIVKSNGGTQPTATELYGPPIDGFESVYDSLKAAARQTGKTAKTKVKK